MRDHSGAVPGAIEGAIGDPVGPRGLPHVRRCGGPALIGQVAVQPSHGLVPLGALVVVDALVEQSRSTVHTIARPHDPGRIGAGHGLKR